MPSRRENWFDLDTRALPLGTTCQIGDFVLSAHDARIVVPLAERVAAGFSQLRVDIHLTGEGPKIGELTAYHGAGRVPWKPPEWDEKLGRLWAAGAPANIE
jgi:TupA-like ATPgrasp